MLNINLFSSYFSKVKNVFFYYFISFFGFIFLYKSFIDIFQIIYVYIYKFSNKSYNWTDIMDLY
jgi:hypothetical protein